MEIPESCHTLCPGACSICDKHISYYSLNPPIDVNALDSICWNPSTNLSVASISWQSSRHYVSSYPNQTYYVEITSSVSVTVLGKVEVIGKVSYGNY